MIVLNIFAYFSNPSSSHLDDNVKDYLTLPQLNLAGF
jgi:hypothetical protein